VRVFVLGAPCEFRVFDLGAPCELRVSVLGAPCEPWCLDTLFLFCDVHPFFKWCASFVIVFCPLMGFGIKF
jgi:hypothetical protein